MQGSETPQRRHQAAAAVLSMAPYSPPTGGPRGQTPSRLQREHGRLLAPRIEALKNGVDPGGLAVYPEYDSARRDAIANYFHVRPEAVPFHQRHRRGDPGLHQYLCRRWPGSRLLRPAYAMYRFYAEVAGANVLEVDYPQPGMDFPLAGCARRHHARTPAPS